MLGDAAHIFPAEDGLFEDTFSTDNTYRVHGLNITIQQDYSASLGVAASVWDSMRWWMRELSCEGHFKESELSGTGQTHWLFMTATYLYERYRFSGDGIAYICRLLSPHIANNTCRNTALTVPQTLCIALRFFASGTFLYTVGDAENISKASVCRSVRTVYLSLKRLLNVFITFPGHRAIRTIKHAFYGIAGFPNVIGALDCTHVRIKCPSGPHEADFVNRNQYTASMYR